MHADCNIEPSADHELTLRVAVARIDASMPNISCTCIHVHVQYVCSLAWVCICTVETVHMCCMQASLSNRAVNSFNHLEFNPIAVHQAQV